MTDTAGWTDTHCHIQETYLDDPSGAEAVLDRALEHGVGRFVCVGTGEEASRQAVALAAGVASSDQRAEVWSTVGLHPHEASLGVGPVAKLLSEVAPQSTDRRPGTVVAVGECGLDYFYEHSPRAAQRDAFFEQIGLAKEHDLALVVHSRGAWDETIEILSSAGVPERTVIHCFTGGPTEARRCLELGAYLSFSGIVTFKNASNVREAAEMCPSDRLLVETDSPFLAPVPHRGRPNEPAYIAIVGSAMAELRGGSASEIAEVTSANAASLFGFSS